MSKKRREKMKAKENRHSESKSAVKEAGTASKVMTSGLTIAAATEEHPKQEAPKRRGRPPKLDNPVPKRKPTGSRKVASIPAPILPSHLQGCSPVWQQFYTRLSSVISSMSSQR